MKRLGKSVDYPFSIDPFAIAPVSKAYFSHDFSRRLRDLKEHADARVLWLCERVREQPDAIAIDGKGSKRPTILWIVGHSSFKRHSQR